MTISKQYICIYKIILKIIKLLTLLDDEPVKRAPAGSGRASGTGAEAPAGAGCVGAAPVAAGWSRRRPRAHARVRARRRGGAGGRRARIGLGRRQRHLAAAAAARRRRLVMRASGRDKERIMKRCGHGASVKILYFRRPPRRPSTYTTSYKILLIFFGEII
jgi:hypothetical protein